LILPTARAAAGMLGIKKFYAIFANMTENNQQNVSGEQDHRSPKSLNNMEEIQSGSPVQQDADPAKERGMDPEAEKIKEPPIPSTASGSKETNTEESSQNTEMEIHHHPRLDHKAKPWKEYLLEGLMIFIAVMMGFIAENVREGITNREHVKDLVSQLVKDLNSDTLQLNEIYKEESEILKANDSLMSLLQFPMEKENMGQLQQFIVRSHDFWPFHPSAGAMGAIKSEIHLKQFSNSEMIGLIADYERHIDLLRTVQEITLQYQRSYIDPFLLHHFTAASLDAAFKKSFGVQTGLRNMSQEDLTQLGADMVLIRINTNELLENNRRLKTDAANLLQYVVGQYNLD
jgi:hypothetical protein